MIHGPMAEALAPFRARMPRAVTEREILRVVATLRAADPAEAFERARREVLIWAQKRSGGRFQKKAWNGEEFDYLAGGRTTLAVPYENDGLSLWALRGDDPDKTVPRRVWTTEITLGGMEDKPTQLIVRLIVGSPEPEIDISPHVPGLVHQIAEKFGLRVGAFFSEPNATCIESEKDAENLIALLESRNRHLPVFVASGDERAIDSSVPLIDANLLARATLGLSHVVVLPAKYSYALSDAFGKARSVYYGAVRAYMRGFDASADPYEHRLFLGNAIKRTPRAYETELRRLAANESLRRLELGREALTFATVRSAAAKLEQTATTGASDADQLAVAIRRIEALEDELKGAQSEAIQNFDLAAAEDERARLAEANQHGLRVRVQMLEEALLTRDIELDADLEHPVTWADFADWCDDALAGRLVLGSLARRGVKKPKFGDPMLAAECVVWLASSCRKWRMEGGGNIANISIEQGIQNAPCGSDTFEFEWQGQRMEADWHIKNGGNTRNPERCLRIYYRFDEATQQIVVADMPAHRRSGAT